MIASLEAFKRAIVRVSGSGGQVYGVGLLVAPQWALTCAHVVADALRVDRNTPSAPAGAVELNLPFQDSGPVSARVPDDRCWHGRNGGNGSDLALLQLSRPLAAVGYMNISVAISFSSGQRFLAWCAQKGHEVDLIPVRGTLEQDIANGRYVANVKKSNYKIRPGCSGAPAVDPENGSILGLIVQEELDVAAEAGFLIPASQLQRVLKQVRASQTLRRLSLEEPGLDDFRSWAASRYFARSRLREDVLRFIDSYGDRPDEPRPFVGRAAVLRQLDQWLAQRGQRFRLVCGAAGRGKSALLLHWLAQLIHARDNDTLIIFYLPISIRFNTAGELVGMQLLFAALCDVFGELSEDFPQQAQMEDYQKGIHSAWTQMASRPELRFLLVVDGLDEAVKQWFVEDRILLAEQPPNLHVLIAARNKQGHTDGAAWLDDLGIRVARAARSGNTPESALLALSALDTTALAEAVVQLGHPLDQLPDRNAFVETLYRLTDQGDPLLLTLWLGQIWRRRSQRPDLDAATLAGVRPSFGGFYDLWMKEQLTVWKAQGKQVHPDDFGQVLHILAFAHGPMLLADLHAVLGHLDAPVRWDFEKLRDVIESASRLVLGEGTQQGYALVHPRLAEYFQQELEASPVRRSAVQAAFREWGAQTVSLLNSSKLSPGKCPHYLLSHYVTAHIDGDGTNAADLLDKYYLPVLQQGWPNAWYAREEAWQGFLNDRKSVLQALRVFNESCIRKGSPAELRLGAEIRCALLAATVNSLTESLPPELTVALATEGIWSIARATRVAMLYDPEQQATCLGELAELTVSKGETEEGRALLQQALDAVEAIQQPGARADALSTLAEQLRGNDVLLEQSLDIAKSIADDEARATALSGVAAALQGDERHKVLQQALEAVSSIRDEYSRAEAISAMAECLHGDTVLLQQAQKCAAAIRDGSWQVQALSSVADQLQGDARHNALERALQTAGSIQDEGDRAQVVRDVADRLQGEDALLERALELAATIQNDKGQLAQTLSAIATHLEGASRHGVLQRALAAIDAIEDEDSRAEALEAVTAELQGDQVLLQEVLDKAAALHSEELCAGVLAAVLANLQGENDLLERARKLAKAIQDDSSRVQALSAAAAQLQEESKREVLESALDAIESIQDAFSRVDALEMIAAELPGQPVLLQRARQAAMTIQDKRQAASALIAIADPLEGDSKRDVLQRALEVSWEIDEPEARIEALSELIPLLQGDARREALKQMSDSIAIHDELPRVRALTAVAARLSGPSRERLLEQALQDAEALKRAELAQALSEVAARLEGESRHRMLARALHAAEAIRSDNELASTLRRIAAESEGEFKQTVLRRALDSAMEIEQSTQRVSALRDLAPQLRGATALLREALHAAIAIEQPVALRGVVALRAIVDQLQGQAQLLQEVLEAAEAMDVRTRIRVLAAVAAQMAGEPKDRVVQSALQALSMIQTEHRAGDAPRIAAVAAQLEGESRLKLMQEAVTVAVTANQRWRARDLTALIPYLQGDGELLRQVLDAAANITEERSRAFCLRELASNLQGQPQLRVRCLEMTLALSGNELQRIAIVARLARQDPGLLTYSVWSTVFPTRSSRPDLLEVLDDLTYLAVQLTARSDTAEEIAVAIQDVCGWWP